MTGEDKVIWDLIETKKMNRAMVIHLKASENLKVMPGTDNNTKLPTLTFANEEINLDFA